MRIDSAGNVDIKSSNLYLTGSNDRRIKLSDSGIAGVSDSNNTVHIRGDNDSLKLNAAGNGTVVFEIDGSEAMRIGSDGKVLINTTSTVGTSTALVEFNNLGSGGRILNTKDNGTGSCNAITFNNNNGQVGRITTDGSGTSYVTSSDYRMKENLVYEWEAISKIKNLKPVQFNFKTNPDELTEGFIAHEAQSIVPYAIVGEKDGEEMQGMDYGKLTAVLTKAIQEQQELIDSLTTRIETLEATE